MNPPNNAQRADLNRFATALANAAENGTVLVNSFTGDYILGDDEALTYAAQAIRDALHRGPTQYPEPLNSANQLRHALNDYLQATPSGARVHITTDHPLDNGLSIDLGTLVDALADAAEDPHLRPTTLNTDVPFDGQIPGRNYHEFAAWWNATTADGQRSLWTRLSRLMREDTTATTRPEPKTKSTNNGQPHDPDPYAIDLRGPHGTIHNADRATLDGLHDLDHRTRAIFKELLYLTLNNLDRNAPTTNGQHP